MNRGWVIVGFAGSGGSKRPVDQTETKRQFSQSVTLRDVERPNQRNPSLTESERGDLGNHCKKKGEWIGVTGEIIEFEKLQNLGNPEKLGRDTRTSKKEKKKVVILVGHWGWNWL